MNYKMHPKMKQKLKRYRIRKRKPSSRKRTSYAAAIRKLRDHSNTLNRDSKEWMHAGNIVLAHNKYELSQAFKYAWLFLKNAAV